MIISFFISIIDDYTLASDEFVRLKSISKRSSNLNLNKKLITWWHCRIKTIKVEKNNAPLVNQLLPDVNGG